MCQNNSATVNLTNNTGLAGTFTVCHQYSNDTPVSGSAYIEAGGTAQGILKVNFNTGFLCDGNDYWWVGFKVQSGNYASEGSCDDPGKQCTMNSSDAGEAMPFEVTMTEFYMNMASGNCSTGVNPVSEELAKDAKLSFKRPSKAKK